MGSSPEELRKDIEQTRAELTEHLDQLAERTSPRQIAHGRKQMLSRRVKGLRERVMGQAEDTAPAAREAAGRATDQARHGAGQAVEAAKAAPDQARRAAGNPLAVGLIAFGAGLLAAAVAPQGESERQAGGRLVERAQPVKDAAMTTARRVAEDAKASGKEAAGHVKDAAADAGKATGSHAGTQAQQVAGQAKESVQHRSE